MPHDVQGNEIIMLLLGLGVLVFVLVNRLRLSRIPDWSTLMAGLLVLLGAWIFTVLESVLWGDVFNFLEHACDAGSAILIAVWCWRVFSQRKALP